MQPHVCFKCSQSATTYCHCCKRLHHVRRSGGIRCAPMKQLPGLLRLAVVGIPASVASSPTELHNCRRWSLFPAQLGIGRSRHPPMKEKPALLRFRGSRDPRLHRQFPPPCPGKVSLQKTGVVSLQKNLIDFGTESPLPTYEANAGAAALGGRRDSRLRRQFPHRLLPQSAQREGTAGQRGCRHARQEVGLVLQGINTPQQLHGAVCGRIGARDREIGSYMPPDARVNRARGNRRLQCFAWTATSSAAAS